MPRLTELRRALPEARALPGSAETIPLPAGSVDAVPAGDAMHWFDMAVAGPEIARIGASAAVGQRDTRGPARGDGGHAGAGTPGHARPDPRVPREPAGDRSR